MPGAAEKQLRVVGLVAVGMRTVDPGEVLVYTLAKKSGRVAGFLGSVGRNSTPQLRQFDPANNQFELLVIISLNYW